MAMAGGVSVLAQPVHAVAENAPDTFQPDGLITNGVSIRRLTREQANQSITVRLGGVVTFAQTDWGNVFPQDDSGGAKYQLTEPADLEPGNRVGVAGFPTVSGLSPPF